MGYKVDSLKRISDAGLPSLQWQHFYKPISGAELLDMKSRWKNRWSLRTDYPVPTDKLLPCITCEDMSDAGIVAHTVKSKKEDPRVEFIFSESPPHGKGHRSFNAVLFCPGDQMLGEISYADMTLRGAWVGGDLIQVEIDGSCRDWHNQVRKQQHIQSLRQIRNLIRGTKKMFEITVMENGRIIFWQDLEFPNYRGWYLNWML